MTDMKRIRELVKRAATLTYRIGATEESDYRARERQAAQTILWKRRRKERP